MIEGDKEWGNMDNEEEDPGMDKTTIIGFSD